MFFNFRLKCKRCLNNIQIKIPPETSDCTSDLSQWYHSANNKGIPDDVLTQAWQFTKYVSFVFHHRSNNALVESTKMESQENIEKSKKKIVKKYDSDEDYVSNMEDDDDDEDWK